MKLIRLFAFALIVIPSIAFSQSKIIVEKTKFLPGEQFKVQYVVGDSTKSNVWIGVIPANIPHGKEDVNDAHDVSYQYTSGLQGASTFEAPLTPGSYDLRMSGGGIELASTGFQVVAVDYKPSLRLTKTAFNPGDDIELAFSVSLQLPKGAWIGVIPSEVAHGDEGVNDQHDVDYQYVGEKTSETFRFRAPEKPGNYDFRLNDSDSNGHEIASVSFQVASVRLEGTLKLKKDTFAPGEAIDVDFTAPEALSRSAWVGMIPSKIPHGNEDVNDQHDIQYTYLEKKASGTLHFVAPPDSGSYDLRMNSSDSSGVEITSVSFKVSGSLDSKTMAKMIAEQGKLTLYGVQFDFNQATIKSESEPVLHEVGTLLQQQPELKLRVEGHTDNVGKPAYNLELSKKRAESVKAYLVQNFKIDAVRLTTDGYGDARPIAKNDTEQGRAQNRRVELVKQ